MDKFVTRQPVAPREVRVTVRPSAPSVQTTIESLSGVVSLWRVAEVRDALIEGRQGPPGDLLRALRDADAMHIALEVLESTEIGKAVHKLCKHADAGVSELARSVERLGQFPMRVVIVNARPRKI